MEVVQGFASHCQNTYRCSRRGKGQAATTYVTLFRLGQRQVQFSAGSPVLISDGDNMIVAGRLWRGTLHADAIRNVTTNATGQSGMASRLFLVLIVCALGASLFRSDTRSLSIQGSLIYLSFAAAAIYPFWRALQIGRAWFYVKHAPL